MNDFTLNPEFSQTLLTKVLNTLDYDSMIEVSVEDVEDESESWATSKNKYKTKNKEKHLDRDKSKAIPRSKCGRVCEKGIEKLTGIPFVNDKIANSKEFAEADMNPAGLTCGIKGCKIGNVPLISPKEKDPQIIVFWNEKGSIFTPGVLFPPFHNKVDRRLVKDAKVAYKGGVCDFSECVPFRGGNQLKRILKERL